MSLSKRRRAKALLKNRKVNWGDVPFGGKRRVAKHVKAFKHAQTRRDRLEAKRQIKEVE